MFVWFIIFNLDEIDTSSFSHTVVTDSDKLYMYILLTKREVKMAEYWPSSLFAFLWTETKSRSIKT